MAQDKPKHNHLAFLLPFEMNLWLAVLGAFMLCAVATTVFSFLSPYGHRGRYVQRRRIDDDRVKNDIKALRLSNSLWYSFAAWMQQVSA